MDEELRQALKGLEHRIEGKIDASSDRALGLIREMIESSETKLLTQFHLFSEGNAARFAQGEAKQRALAQVEEAYSARIAALESRILNLEKGRAG